MTTTKKLAKALILNVMTFGWILNKQTGHVGRYNEILQSPDQNTFSYSREQFRRME